MGITSKQRGTHVFPDGSLPGVRTYSAAGAINPAPGAHIITAGPTGVSMTLAAPGRDGVLLEIDNVMTATQLVVGTGLFRDGATAALRTTLTFDPLPGASITLRGYGGKYLVIAKNGVTVT